MNQVITSQTNFLGMYVQLKNNFIFCFVIILLKKKKKQQPLNPLTYQKVENVLSSILHFFFSFIQPQFMLLNLSRCVLQEPRLMQH